MGNITVHNVDWYIRHLDTSMYGTHRELRAAARQLRDADVVRRREDRKIDDWLSSRQLHSMGERRHAVRHGWGKWCSGFLGFGGCHNTGVIIGRDGVRMKCGRCNGEGVRLKRKSRRSKARGKAWRP